MSTQTRSADRVSHEPATSLRSAHDKSSRGHAQGAMTGREANDSMSLLRSKLILASASPRRLALLKSIGMVPSEIIPADIDESVLKGEAPRDYVARVARGKCEKIVATHPDAIVLAGDTAVACGSRILPKAETEAQARACLALLSGRRHRVLSGVCVWRDGKYHARVVESMVQFDRLSKSAIEGYIASGEWEGKAGGYAIQGLAATFVKQMRGSHSNIVGLPLYEVAKLLNVSSLV